MLTSQAKRALHRHAVGDHRRDPRGGADQARRAPGRHAGAAGRAGGPRRAAHRALRDAAAARGGRSLPRRPVAGVHHRRRRRAQAAGPAHPRTGGVHGRAGRPASSSTRLPGGSEATRRSIWPAIYPELLSLVREHRSTLVFVNNRRAAERIALRLNDLAAQEAEAAGESPREIARAHHGSLAREERVVIEDQLKSGPAAVSGGHVVAGAGHRHGRCRPRDPGGVAQVRHTGAAAHRPRRARCGRGRRAAASSPSSAPTCSSAPSSRGACARDSSRRRSCRATRSTCWPSRSSPSRRAPGTRAWWSTSCTRCSGAPGPTPSSSGASSTTCWTCSTAATPRRSSPSCAPRIVWDRVAGTVRARSGARALAVANAGTIPDRGLFSVNLPDGRRVGELDEEMVYEARAGQTFLLGATTWRIEQITRDRVVVTPAPGMPGAVPFWHGESVGRPPELGRGHRCVRAGGGARATRRPCAGRVRPRRAGRLQPARVPARAGGGHRRRALRPDARRRALPRRDRRLAAVRALAVRRARARGLGARALRAHPRPVRPRGRRDLVGRRHHRAPAGRWTTRRERSSSSSSRTRPRIWSSAELGSSALFGARFRENAARSLLIPRAYPGRRTPLWQQRLKAQSLLEVARRYPQFPVILETYRECLRDVLDVPGLQDLLRKLSTREISLVEVETQTASPFASSLLFDYVAAYMYEGDTPAAERRAVALSLDRELLRELLGQEELRDLIDPAALEQVEDELQHRAEHLRARDAYALPRRAAARRRPDRGGGGGARGSAGRSRGMAGAARGRAPRRARSVSAARSAGSPPRTPGCSATPWASSRPAACPTRSSRTCRTRCSGWCAATHARTARSRPESSRTATVWTSALSSRSWSGPATFCAASCARWVRSASGATRTCCAACGGRRSPCFARRSSPSAGDAGALRAGLARRRPLRRGRGRRGPPARRARAAPGSAARARGLGEGCAAAPAWHLFAVLARRALRQRRGGLGRGRAARSEDGARRAVLPRRRAGAGRTAGSRRRAGRGAPRVAA